MGSHQIHLHFVVGAASIELFTSEFYATEWKHPQRTVRGKTAGAFHGHGTFQWTTAVRAVAILMIRTKLSSKLDALLPTVGGYRDSLAASLDYAVSKTPDWISEMFGYGAAGVPIAKRLFTRSNPNRKRPGPVVISVNERLLTPNDILIWLNDQRLESAAELQQVLENIEQQGTQECPLKIPLRTAA